MSSSMLWTHFEMTRQTRLLDSSVWGLFSRPTQIPFQHIRHVDLSENFLVTAQSAVTVLQTCTFINSLSLKNCLRVDLEALCELLCELPRVNVQLKRLDIQGIRASPYIYSHDSLTTARDLDLLRNVMVTAETLNEHLSNLSGGEDILFWSPCPHCRHQLANTDELCVVCNSVWIAWTRFVMQVGVSSRREAWCHWCSYNSP